MVESDNRNKESEIRYDDVNFTVARLGAPSLPGSIRGTRRMRSPLNSSTLNRTAKVDGKTYFRMNFTMLVKYRIMFFYTAQHRLWGGANVTVNDAGLKDEKDDIRLGHSLPVIESGATPLTTGCHRMLLLLGLLVHFALLGLSL
ncbi:protein NDR1-like [Neltuma alba]|uniref:protein NDR1-like n=1 Tax=Neltuma alba TaxID=207710 RepID=UPI0010A2FCE2|nr:protein NDR1-like [Prosopis alba]